LVLFARESLRNPYLALTFAGDLNEDVSKTVTNKK
jgi:hypothetical protein